MALSRFWKLSQPVALKFPLRPTELLVLLQLLSDLNGRFLSVSSLISMQHACVITHYYTLGVRERSDRPNLADAWRGSLLSAACKVSGCCTCKARRTKSPAADT